MSQSWPSLNMNNLLNHAKPSLAEVLHPTIAVFFFFFFGFPCNTKKKLLLITPLPAFSHQPNSLICPTKRKGPNKHKNKK